MQDIIDKSGLSKGAIYHYVSGKDELFGLILKSKMDQTNSKFYEVVCSQNTAGIINPLKVISEGASNNSGNDQVTNKIFIYLLSKMESPKVESIMKDIYSHNLSLSTKWIEVGQEAGVIPLVVNAEKMAELFITFMYGMRVQNTINKDQIQIGMDEIFQVMFRALQ
jgi:AcrR family transcriptional regulator